MIKGLMPLRRPGARLAAFLCFAALVGCAGPERPKPSPLEPNNPLISVNRVWSANVGAVDFPLDVRVVGKSIYLAGAAGEVAALHADTGAVIWRVRLGVALSAGVGSDGRHAAVVSRENELIVLDAGQEIWRRKLPALTLTAPLVAGGRVFAVSADKTLTGFDLVSGALLWQQKRSSDALVLGQAGVLTAVGNNLIVGIGGRLAGADPLSGKSRWETIVASSRGTNEVERLADVVSGFSRSGNQLCVRSFQYAVACMDGQNGRSAWTRPANGGTGLGGDAELVIGTESDGRILAWRRKDGEPLWTTDRLRFWKLSAPLVADGLAVVGDDTGVVHFLSKKDGSPLNRVATDGSGIAVTPVQVGSDIVVVTRKGLVQAFRTE